MEQRTPPVPRVVVTGANGAIGRSIGERLSKRWELVATDIRNRPGPEHMDVTNEEQCRRTLTGADAVVHLAAVPDPAASWNQLLPANVIGTYTVAATAAAVGVRRLVLASSLQAVSAERDDRQSRSTDPPRPANLYGATKAWAEALGSWVAATSTTSVVALRIGYFNETPPEDDKATPRNLGAWLSPRDCAELVRSAVESTSTGFTVVNGVSANRHRIAEYGDAEIRLGYVPVDDAWTHT